MKAVTKLVGPTAYYDAKRKATYGRKDWIFYSEKSGLQVAELLSVESLKRAMIAKGTRGKSTIITFDGNLLLPWPFAVNQLKYPYNSYRKGPAVRPLEHK